MTVEYFGQRDFAINYGLVFVGYGIGCFLGPLIGGWVHDATKSYLAALYFAGSLALAGNVMIYLLRKPVNASVKAGARVNAAGQIKKSFA